MIALLAVAALAAPFGLDRVDLVSEDSAWLVDELPRAGIASRTVAFRYAQQVQPTWFTPVKGLTVGTSVRAVSLQLEQRLSRPGGLYGSAALVTRFGLPHGARVGLAVRKGPLRVGGSVALLSTATWSTPEWTTWRVLPTLGVGVGRIHDRRPVAPWKRDRQRASAP